MDVLNNQTDLSLYIPLSQYRDRLMHQKSRWVTPMASALRFDAHVENSKILARQSTGKRQSESLGLKWIHEPESSSNETRYPNLNQGIVLATPPEDDSETEPADSDVEELFGENSLSNEADEILITEAMESLDEVEEDGNTDSSAMVYSSEDLSLDWEPPVRNRHLDVNFNSHHSLGYSR